MATLNDRGRNSFVVGFLFALALVAGVYLWNHSGVQGGPEADSPNGLYKILVLAPLSPTMGGSYTIQLIDKKTSTVIRHVVVSVPRSEKTVTLREGGGAISWDLTSNFADIIMANENSIRVWIPQRAANTARPDSQVR